jgi:hypothetical protein
MNRLTELEKDLLQALKNAVSELQTVFTYGMAGVNPERFSKVLFEGKKAVDAAEERR